MPSPAPPGALVARLRAAGCAFAEEEAALLAAEASGDRLAALADRRCAGEPLEQVLGWAEVDGLRVRVAPAVFVPRRRTALLARTATALLAERAGRDPVLVDLCCGTGVVAALVLAGLEPRDLGVEAHAADLDPAATACAAANLGDRAEVHTGDLWDALPSRLRGRVDVATCNAPYVPTGELGSMPREAREHEPRHALDGGADGVVLHRRVAAEAPAWLAPGGRLLVETGRHQASLTAAACADAGLAADVVTDDDLAATVVVARRP